MVNPITKRDAPSSRFERHIEEAVSWIEKNQETFWGVVVSVVVIGAFIGFVVHQRAVTNTDAWQQLGAVQSFAMKGDIAGESKALKEWEPRFANSSVGAYARFLKADLLYKTSDYAGATQLYSELAQSARPANLRPLALSAEASSEEMAGHLPEAESLAARFTDQYPDHFLAASLYLTQARIADALGDKTKAVGLYDRIALLYPQSPMMALAKARSQVLAPASTSPASAAPAPASVGLAAPAHP